MDFFRSTRLPLVVATGILLAIALYRYFQNLPRIFDIILWDETIYLHAGLDRSIPLPGPYENSGLYSLIYRGIGTFIRDPIHVYQYGGVIILVTAFTLMFLAFLNLSKSLTIATAFSAFFLLADTLTIWPRISFAAMACLALWLLAAYRLPLAGKTAAALLAAFLMSFIRPEFSLSFTILAVVAIVLFAWEAIRAWRRRSKEYIGDLVVAGAILAIVVTLCVDWSIPLPKADSRSFLAFGQHYSIYLVDTYKLPNDPWLDWQNLTARSFPGATTVFEALRANPIEFFTFMLANLKGTISALSDFLRDFWTTARDDNDIVHLASLAVVILLPLSIFVWRVTHAGSQWRAARRELETALILLAFIAPVLVATLYVYPARHYLVQLLFMLMALLALAAGALHRPLRGEAWLGLLVGIAVLLVTPTLRVVDRANLDVIRALRQLGPIGSMAELDGNWCAYLPPPCRFVPLYAAFAEPIEKFVAEAKPDTLMISSRLLKSPHFATDAWLKRVLSEPASFGFKIRPLPHGHKLVILRPQATR